MEQFEEIYQTAKSWTLEAGRKLKASLEENYKVEFKTSEADLVTEKDREIEQFFILKISEAYPTHRMIGEEGMHTEKEFDPFQEIVWVIDPIDGTTNFVHQKESFAISVAIYENGKPKIGIVYDAIKDECFHALIGKGAFLNDTLMKPLTGNPIKHSLIALEGRWLIPNDLFDCEKFHPLVRESRGTRIIGAAALELVSVACGRLNAYIHLTLSPWDYGGALVILLEQGAKLTNIHNEPIHPFEKTSIVAASPSLHSEIMEDYLIK